jgi:alpha-ketoglutarate-dependent taurine dioxygenase
MERNRTRDPAQWLSPELEQDASWIFALDSTAGDDVAAGVLAAARPGQHLFDYRREDFDFGRAAPVIEAAFRQAKHGRGISLLRNLPRTALTEEQFALMTWGIGLHQGVARPQSKASQYLSPVRDAGVDYRSATGRGYSSNAELDYHTDRADVIVLSCYNKARSGGKSMVVSTAAALDRFAQRHPALLAYLHRPLHFSRQGEIRPGQDATFAHPLVTAIDGRRFVRWNRNRVKTAQDIPGVPRIDADFWHALDTFDAILSEPDIEFSMYLQPGDIEILNGNVTLHARTNYVDFDDPAQRRLLFRLWLSTPDSPRLPDSWTGVYGSVEPRAVRGGILGDAYDARCRAFDRRQAAVFGMSYDPAAHR